MARRVGLLRPETLRLPRVVFKAQDLMAQVAQGTTINAVCFHFQKLVLYVWWQLLLPPTHLVQWLGGVFATKEWKKVTVTSPVCAALPTTDDDDCNYYYK